MQRLYFAAAYNCTTGWCLLLLLEDDSNTVKVDLVLTRLPAFLFFDQPNIAVSEFVLPLICFSAHTHGRQCQSNQFFKF